MTVERQAENIRRKTARVKTPTLLQMEATECGAASLGIILRYFGKYVPLEELRETCGISRDGSKAKNIATAARKYGLEAAGYRKELHELLDMTFPMIVFWDFNHFLVVEGFNKDKVFLNDPASGPRSVSYELFDKSFTGVVLTFKPGPDFQKGGEKPSVVKGLKDRGKGSWLSWLYVFFTGLCLVVPGLVIPTFFRIFVDDVLITKSSGWMILLLIAMVVAVGFSAFLTWVQGHVLLRLQMKLALFQSGKFFWHVLRLPMRFFSQRFSGEIGSRVMINDSLAEMLAGPLAKAGLSILMVVFYAALMLQYDILMTVIAVGFSAMNIAVLRYVSRKRVDLNQKLMQDCGKSMGLVMGGFQMIETLKATGAESEFFNQLSGAQAKIINARQKLGMYTGMLVAAPVTITVMSTAMVLMIGGLRVMGGHMTMGMLIAFQTLLAGFIMPFNQLVNIGSSFQTAVAGINRLDDVLKYPADMNVPDTVIKDVVIPKKTKLAGYVDIKNLTFGYNLLEPPLIKDFSLSLKPGARVALVGRSGSGKSTIAKLISGLYEPWSGEIRFDDILRHEVTREVFTNSYSFVDQEIFLFEGPVRDNISMWNKLITDNEIINAARDSHIHDVIIERPGGYDSAVSEGGRNYSGGQNQRLEIARALAINPTVLVFDEATTALDANTESIIDHNIRRRGCTTIIVAHRLSTIRDCDEIIVLENGVVTERGDHEALIANNGPYARLIKME